MVRIFLSPFVRRLTHAQRCDFPCKVNEHKVDVHAGFIALEVHGRTYKPISGYEILIPGPEPVRDLAMDIALDFRHSKALNTPEERRAYSDKIEVAIAQTKENHRIAAEKHKAELAFWKRI